MPVTSSVLVIDSLNTQNLSGEAGRVLIGGYTDPVFGTVQAQTIAQIRPASVNTFVTGNTFDSLILALRVDFYTYGAAGKTTHRFSIHEATEEMDYTKNYFSNSSVAYDPTPLATTQIVIDQDYFKGEYEDTDADSILLIKFKMDQFYGQRLFNFINPEDEQYTNFSNFKKYFKGLVIVSEQADKIIGITPTDLNTAMVMYSHEGETKETLAFSIASGVIFSKITTDRTGSELAGFTQFFQDYNLQSARYIQAGGSVLTKLDFSYFYNYMDTIPNAILNSVELSVENVTAPPATMPLPASLNLSILKGNNRYRIVKSAQDTTDLVAYAGSLVITDQTIPNQAKMSMAGDQGALFTLNYSTDDKKYTGSPTLFFQKLYEQRANRIPYWALQSNTPSQRKSVNRTSFPQDKIKLRVYYTRPAGNPNQ